jgi:hypothetical protein
LNSLYLTAAWNDDLSITVQGTGGSNFSYTVTVNTSGPTFITLNWADLTSVLFTPSGGTPHGFTPSGGTPHGFAAPGGEHFALDNVTIDAASTPLPATWTMLIAGFIGLGFFAYHGTKNRSAAIAAA